MTLVVPLTIPSFRITFPTLPRSTLFWGCVRIFWIFWIRPQPSWPCPDPVVTTIVLRTKWRTSNLEFSTCSRWNMGTLQKIIVTMNEFYSINGCDCYKSIVYFRLHIGGGLISKNIKWAFSVRRMRTKWTLQLLQQWHQWQYLHLITKTQWTCATPKFQNQFYFKFFNILTEKPLEQLQKCQNLFMNFQNILLYGTTPYTQGKMNSEKTFC